MKKKLLIIIPIIIALVVFLGVYIFLNYEDKNTSLTIMEKRWIENNQVTKLNLDIINDMPIFGENGTGVMFDFAKDFELATDLEFNKIPYSFLGSPSSKELRFRILSNDVELTNKDLLLYEDGYILIGYDNVRYDGVEFIDSKTVGTLTNDMSEATYYMKTSNNITYKNYDNIDALINALTTQEVNMILVPQTMYLNYTIGLENTYINYYFTELHNKVVLTLTDDNDKLNSIVTKYFNNWKEQNYVKKYNSEYLDYYIAKKNISDKDRSAMLSKTYVYGYVENAPYEVELDGKVVGIVGEYISRIQRLTGIDISYKKYSSHKELEEAINKGKVDLYFNNFSYPSDQYLMTISPTVEKYAILGNSNIGTAINSFESLKGEKIAILENNSIYNYFKEYSKANIVPVTKVDELKKENSLIVVDKEVYDYYRTSKLKKFENIYEGYATVDYNFGIKNDNKLFYELLNYVIGTNSYYNYRMVGLDSMDVNLIERTTFGQLYVIILGLVLLPLLVLVLVVLFMKKKKRVKVLKKEDKRKYTDMLTSLKNRNYLNFNMESWDELKVYPKDVIIIDLNNVSYVNDNYGHEEGDKLIIKAANILVNTQLENSEIMRTDGNEFLIYLVGYSAKQIETYTKRLAKELKDLPHGFGASLGYSVIEDDIKTLDDAITEAYLEMKTEKEKIR